MVLLVEPLVQGLELEIKPIHECIDRVVEGIEVRTVACMMVFITRQHEFLKLAKQI